MKDWYGRSQRSGITSLWRPKKKEEPTEGGSGRASFTRSEAARGLTDLEKQQKRGPKLV